MSLSLRRLRTAFVPTSEQKEVMALSEVVENLSNGKVRPLDDHNVDRARYYYYDVDWMIERIDYLLDMNSLILRDGTQRRA